MLCTSTVSYHFVWQCIVVIRVTLRYIMLLYAVFVVYHITLYPVMLYHVYAVLIIYYDLLYSNTLEYTMIYYNIL